MKTTVTDRGWKKAFRAFVHSVGSVTVGIHDSDTDRDDGGPTNAEVGWFNEYSGEKRPFLRPTFDDNKDEYLALQRKLFAKAARGGMSVDAAMTILGAQAKADVKETIISGIPPELAKATKRQRERKGQGTTPLIATGQLLDAIDFEVK